MKKEINLTSESERISKLISESKKIEIDNYFVGNYCDALDQTKNWCIAEVIHRTDDKVKIHFEGWSSKFDEVLSIKSRRLAHFRKFSRGYTGQKSTAFRLYTFKYDDFLEIKSLIRLIIETNFTCLTDPLEISQILRGKIFTWIDIFMTCPFNLESSSKGKNVNEDNEQLNSLKFAVPEILQLLYDFIELFVLYLNFVKENLYISEIIEKYPDLYLIDNKCALFSCYREFLLTIKRIFGKDERTNNFFRLNENLLSNEISQRINNSTSRKKICKPELYKSITLINKVQSNIIVNFIEEFNSKSGFSLLFDIIFAKFNSVLSKNQNSPNNKNQQDNFPTSNTPIFLIYNISQILDYSNLYIDFTMIFSSQISKFKEFIFYRMNNLSDSEIKDVDPKIIEKLAYLIRNVFSFDGNELTAKIYNEEINLIYAYKCFISKILEKRIKGISYIDKLVEVIFLKESLYNFTGESGEAGEEKNLKIQNNIPKQENNEDICCLDSDYLLFWIKEKKLLESILGENIHEEILKRSLNIFILYVKKNSLPVIVYDSICKDLLTKHESIAKEIQNIICEIALYMTQKEKNIIFEKLSQNNFKSFNEDLIIFIKNLTMNCIKLEKGNYKDNLFNQFVNINLYGIPILWNFFLDSEGNNYVEITYQCLEEIFKTCNLQEEIMMKYLILCLENLHSSKSVVQSLKLFRNLLVFMDRIKKDTYDDQNILKILNERYSIIELIVADFERYYIKVSDELKPRNKKSESIKNMDYSAKITNNSNTIYEGFYPHLKNIENRLETLNFINSYSNIKGLGLEINISHIEKLWDFIITSKYNKIKNSEIDQGLLHEDNINEKNIFYNFLLYDYENNSFEGSFNEKLIKEIFEKILMNPEKFNTESMSLSAFNLYIKFFKQVNLNEEKVVYVHKKLRICDDNLTGYENLWEFLISCKDESIRKECAKFLIYLSLNPRKFEEEICNKLWTKFSNLLIKYIEKLKNTMEFGSLVILIKQLYLELSSPGYIAKEKELEKYTNTFPVLFVNSNKNEKKTIQVGQNELVCEVREKISFIYSLPLITLALKINKKIIDYNDDEFFFREVFDSNFYAEIIQVSNPLLKFQHFNLKKLVIDNDYIFEVLFNYLDINKESDTCKKVFEEIWELLSLLPSNKKFEEKILNLGKKSIDKNENIFKSFESIYQIAYILKIVKNFVDKENLDWIEKFNQNKGFIRLTEIIIYLSYREELFINSSDLAFDCFNDILNILAKANKVFFIGFNFSLFSVLFSNPDHKNEFIKMILKVITFIFKSSIAIDKDKNLNKIQEDFQRKLNREFIHQLFFINKEKKAKEIHDEQKGENSKDKIISKSSSHAHEEINSNELIQMDEKIHPDILNRWNKEALNLGNFIRFLSNQFFQPEEILKNFLDKSGVKILKEYFSLCFIYSRNSKIKFDLYSFLNMLFSHSNNSIKKGFILNVYQIIFSKDVVDILTNLNNTLPKSSFCEDYFKILKLITTNCEGHFQLTDNFILENMTLEEQYKFEEFVIIISKFIKTYIKNKKVIENTENENVIIGYMSLLKDLSIINQKVLNTLTEEKMFKFLVEYFFKKENYNNIDSFEKNTFTPSSKLKSASYDLISCLCYNSLENQEKIMSTLSDYLTLGFWRTKRILDWKITVKEKRSSLGYAGLKNLGCTCYMNSLLQQFFMIDSLRSDILAIPDKENIPLQESLLFQLKSIFASLKFTEMKYVNPNDFCSNFRNYDGRVMNVFEQMDIDEYYNLLLEQLEPFIKGTNQENIFKHHFSGTISNEFICKGCPHSSVNQDPFSSISLEVKNKKSVLESLDSYVKDEILEGENAYFCEQCNKKVNALKRQSIKTLPKILVLVLKRFQFDYNTMTKSKVNDYCEFPMKLDMKPYTLLSSENKKLEENNLSNEMDESQTLYDLSGVVIHAGSAESGHYYSMIKDMKNSKWYEFNDTHITPFEIEEFPQEAFGGISDEEKSIEKSTNAYVLFYTKTNDKSEETDSNFSDAKNSIQIQSNIMKKINIDNFQLWVSNILFSKEYIEFMQQFILSLSDENNNIISSDIYNSNSKNLKILSKNDGLDAKKGKLNKNLNIPVHLFSYSIKMSSLSSKNKSLEFTPKLENFMFIIKVFLFNVLRIKDKSFLATFVDIIKTYINLNYQNAYWLLEEFSNSEIISEFLIDCPFNELRKITAGLICCSMIKYIETENKLTPKKSKEEETKVHKSPLLNFIQSILFIINNKKQNIGKNFSTLNYIIWKFSLINIETKQFLVDTKVLNYLIKFFKGKNIIGNLSQLLQKENLSKNPVHPDNTENLEEIMQLKIREPEHKELAGKLMTINEKTSAIEEYFEKKQLEKNSPPYSDLHLFMTLQNIIIYSDLEYYVKNEANTYSVILSEEDKILLDFKDLNFLKLLIKESKSKQSTLKICELFKSLCYENIEITESLGSAFMDLLNLSDFGECEVVMKIFKEILLIEDNLQYNRVRHYSVYL
jgi:ubiquitin C-terminal hydrolase